MSTYLTQRAHASQEAIMQIVTNSLITQLVRLLALEGYIKFSEVVHKLRIGYGKSHNCLEQGWGRSFIEYCIRCEGGLNPVLMGGCHL